MSSILDSIINDTFIKLKPLNKQIIFHNDNNNFRIDSRIRRDKSKKLWTNNKFIKNKGFKINSDSNSIILQNKFNNNSFYLKDINNSNFENPIDISKNNKTVISNMKYIDLKSLFNNSKKSLSNNINKAKISIIKRKSLNQNDKIQKMKRYLLKSKKPSSVNHHPSFKNFQRYIDFLKFEKINKATSIKNSLYNSDDISKLNFSQEIKNNFIKDKFGIYLYKNKYMNEHFSLVKKCDKNVLFNDEKKKESKQDLINYFNKLKKNFLEENKQIRKKVKSSYSSLEAKQKIINLSKKKINTPTGFRKIYFSFNKKRAEKENILTNLYINESKNPKTKTFYFGEKVETSKIINKENIAGLAVKKINKLYHDLLIFKLPNLDENFYIRKLLYDVFIEFKNMLLLSMMKNKDINLYKNGLDFESFYNCNTKINQQGQILAKRLFNLFNNKSNDKYISLENYVNGMLKLKNSNKENKLNLFFDMLDENSKGFMTYDDIYKFGIISLQKITLNLETMDDFEKAKKDKNNHKSISVIENLADFFSKMIFKLVNIDIKEKIPLKLLKKMIIQGGEQADYIEFLFGSGNF